MVAQRRSVGTVAGGAGACSYRLLSYLAARLLRNLLCMAQSGRRSPISLRTHDDRTDRGHGHMDRRG